MNPHPRPSADDQSSPHGEDDPRLAVYGVETPPAPRTLIDIVESTIDSHPDAVALEDDADEITYAELSELVESQRQRLWDLGIGRGDRVGIRVPSGTTDLYVAILATLFAGAAYVPVDFDDPDSRADTVWREANVAAVFGAGLEIVQRLGQNSDDLSEPELGDDAWIIFTSGSTGTPKGVAVSHRSAAALVDAEARMYLVDRPLGPGDRVMAGLSVAFDASCEEMWLAWRYGAALVAAPRSIVRSGPDLGDWIMERDITAVSTVPTLASLWPAEAMEAVRLLIFGGEACPLELVGRLTHPGREVWNTYGPTEATVIATGQKMTADPPVRIGRPVPGWALAVVDPEGEPVEWGETGELIISGVGLGRYLDPAKDAEKYAPLPSLGWERAYRTGDVVRAEREGLVFGGRADDQIKLGGRRLELGEIDEHLSRMPGVHLGAAALHRTAGGSDVLVGYLVAESEGSIDLDVVRKLMAKHLPGGIVPSLTVLDQMPMKTSGKVDRGALPWPLTSSDAEAGEDLDPDLIWLAELWAHELGPIPLGAESNFFDLGGGSVQVARLVAALRRTHPSTAIAEVYEHPTLRGMSDYLEGLAEVHDERPLPEPIPRLGGVFQAAFVSLLYVYNGLRYVLGAIIVVWFLAVVFDAGWVVAPPWIPLAVGWVVLFSLPGRVLLTALGVRLLTARLRPGRYLRGGWTHLRVWAADRLIILQRLDLLWGTPMAPTFPRLLGTSVGRDAHLHHQPSVTGLVTLGDGVAIEPEADLNGHWIDGDVFILGEIVVDDGARVGTRTLLAPGAHVGAGAEIVPGSYVEGTVPAGELWGGSPAGPRGVAGETWPEGSPSEAGNGWAWGPVRSWAAHSAGVVLVGLLPLLAILPGALLILHFVGDIQTYEEVFPDLAMWTPVFTILTVITWLFLVIGCVRVTSSLIVPGYFPQTSAAGWGAWFTHTLMQRTLVSTYPIYASCITPVFMRLLGARVGRDTEISTLETIPHLTYLNDRTFVADHALVNSVRTRGGWLHIGTTVIGEGAFVGNSAIVGPDRDLPAGSLIAVLSSTPYQPALGSSWLGRKAKSIPRIKVEADAATTFRPAARLKVARAMVESCRILPAIIAAWLDLMIVYALTSIYMNAGPDHHMEGILRAALWSGPVVLAAGILASLIPVAAKWALIGVFRRGDRPLFSTFVWRSELADSFAESLAVPSLVRLGLGSPLYNVWARLMGSKIGRDVWCETWWLPEFDLITVEDRATVNRGTVLQTHLFHDRVMGMETVRLGVGATLAPNSFMLPGSAVGERTTVRPGSMVLRQEEVPSDGVWGGNPVQHLDPDEVDERVVVDDRSPALPWTDRRGSADRARPGTSATATRSEESVR